MSEYQCYEFVALDRPLTPDEMAELRSISTRADISPRSVQILDRTDQKRPRLCWLLRAEPARRVVVGTLLRSGV